MKALATFRFGTIESLAVQDVATPTPGPGQIRVRVTCAAVNPADPKVLCGEFIGRMLHGRPTSLIPGYDVAGVIDAVGDGVQGLAVGDQVWGHQQYSRHTVHGTFAE